MSVQIAAFPSQPATIQSATLDGVSYHLRLTWNYRLAAWYLDLWTLDMTPIRLGQRLSPGWSPTAGYDLPDAPAGQLYVRGLDGYARDDLGAGLVLLYFTEAELQAGAATLPGDPTVVVTL